MIRTETISDSLFLDIAGLGMSINGAGVRLRTSFDAPYAPFTRDCDQGGADLHATVRVESLENLSVGAAIYDAGGSWTLHEGNDGAQWMLRRAPLDGDPTPQWAVRVLDGDWTHLEIRCSPRSLRDGAVDVPVQFPLDLIVWMRAMAERDGLILHASSVLVADEAFVFAGHSGAGKTTISSIFAEAGACDVLSDDRTILRRGADAWIASGTPWSGTGGLSCNRSAKLGGVFVLRQGEIHTLRSMDARAAFMSLLPLVSVPWYEMSLGDRIVQLVRHLSDDGAVRELTFRPTQDVIDFVVAA